MESSGFARKIRGGIQFDKCLLGRDVPKVQFLEGLDALLTAFVETFVRIYAILGLGYSFLNRPNASLTYLSEAAYPVYIIHWFFINLGAYYLFPAGIPLVAKFWILTAFTFGGSLLLHHLLIRRFNVLRPVFGLRLNSHPKSFP